MYVLGEASAPVCVETMCAADQVACARRSRVAAALAAVGAQAGAKDDVPAASAALRGHVEEFYQLEPRRIQEKFGLSDL